MKLHVLTSGSSGNCILIEAGSTRVLVDCGVSGAEVARRMDSIGCRPETLQAIVVSHEHSDHIQGVGVLSRRFGLPVYLTPGTQNACRGQIGNVEEWMMIEAGREFEIGELGVRPFSIPHDASDPVGFTFHHGAEKAGVATDIGFSTALARQHLASCRLLVLEANHDAEMLARGPYPWELKRRIRGRRGHLSNEESGKLLERIVHEDLGAVVLAHLSEKNNRPDLARRAAAEVLSKYRMGNKVRLEVAGRREIVTVTS